MALQEFGIFSPTLGLRQDIPSILMPAAFTEDNSNVLLHRGEVQRAKMRSAEMVNASLALVPLPDGNPPIVYHWYQQDDGDSYLLAFTKTSIYHWDAVNLEWDRKHINASDCDDWSVVTYNNIVLATNNIDKVLYWNGTDSMFRTLGATSKYSTGVITVPNADATVTGTATWAAAIAAGDYLHIVGQDRAYKIGSVTDDTHLELEVAFEGATIDGAGAAYEVLSDLGLEYATGKYLTKAKVVTSFEDYLVLGHTTKDGTLYPQGIDWCANGDYTDWLTGDSGSDVVEGSDQLTGFGHFQDFLLIFKQRSFTRMWLTDSDYVFNKARMSAGIGTYAPHSIVNGPRGECRFFASDFTFREVRGSTSDHPIISDPIIDVCDKIPPSYVSLIKSMYVYEYAQTWWSLPYGAEATTNNLVVKYKDGSWGKQDMAVAAFGSYERTSGYTIDTIPFAHIEDIDWKTIDTVEANPDYRLDLCGNYSGNTYGLHNGDVNDAGAAFAGYAVLATDLAGNQGLSYYKRLLKMKLYFRGQLSGTADIYIRRDHESGWQSAGSVSLAGSADIIVADLPCDYLARHFLLKVAGSNTFRFLGVIFEYVRMGLRG